MSARSRLSFLRSFMLLAAVTVTWGPAPLAAQSAESTVTGTVTDASGGVLSGATLEAVSGGRSVAVTTTGPDGRYRLTLPAGARYELRVRREGFSPRMALVTATSGATHDFQLSIAPFNDALVVTPSGTARSRASTADTVTVFTSDEIAARGSHSVADIVAQIPGLEIAANGREGAVTSLFSRGGESDYNQVLIDGVRVNINGGQFDFSRVSAAEIDRVEVVRGAQSARYGSDAIGSVVQIFTRRGSPRGGPQVAGSVEGGSFGTFRGDVRVLGGARDQVDYQLGVAQRSTDGAFADRLAEDDTFDETSLNGNVGSRLSDRVSLRTGFRFSEANGRGVGAIDYTPGDTGQVYDTEELSWYLGFDGMMAPAVTHRANARVFRYDSVQRDTIGDVFPTLYTILEGTPGARFPDSPRLARIVDEDTYKGLLADPAALGSNQFLASTPFGVFFGDAPFTFSSSFRRYELDYQVDAAWMAGQVFSAGYDYLDESDPASALFTVKNHAVFAQQQFTLRDRWFVTLGARVDDNSRFGTEVSPKLSLGGFPLPFTAGAVSSVKVFANLGRGIKNPTFGELFPSAFSDGNADLKPERARTFDTGAEATLGDQRWLARATYFSNRFDDQVAFRSSHPGFTPDGLPDYLNIAGSKARGVELEFGLQRPVGGLTAGASYALVDTEVVEAATTSVQFQPGQPLIRRPRHSGIVDVNYAQGRGSVHFQLRAVGARHDSAFAGLFTPDFQSVDITVNPGYGVMNLGGQVRVHEALTVFLQIENLADERYSTTLGYPGMPRAVVVGGRFRVGR